MKTALVLGVSVALGLASVGLFGLGVSACGGGDEVKSAYITPGEMPPGQSWNGVYFHPVFGYLHMVEQDSNIVGRWKRSDQSAWGELSGVIRGNVVHYTWKEHMAGMVGPSAEQKGKGYFIYKMNSDDQAELKGEYGNNAAEVGSRWDCKKQQRMEPDLKSIGGPTAEESVRPGGLD